MLVFATVVLRHLGATSTVNVSDMCDPTTEEEFKKLEFTSPTPITWSDYQSTLPIVQAIIAQKSIRKYRDQLLRNSDWIMTVDNIDTLANKEEWIAYRQALRDMPTTVTEYTWIPESYNLDFSKITNFNAPPVIRK
jgi:hypothetical protein